MYVVMQLSSSFSSSNTAHDDDDDDIVNNTTIKKEKENVNDDATKKDDGVTKKEMKPENVMKKEKGKTKTLPPAVFTFSGEYSVVVDPAGGDVGARIEQLRGVIGEVLGVELTCVSIHTHSLSWIRVITLTVVIHR